MMTNHLLQRYLAVAGVILLCVGLMVLTVASEPKVRIIQTNSAGDNIHVIDPVTNKVVGVINGIEVNHGAAVAPDGSRIYISDEAESTLDVVDAKTLKVIDKNARYDFIKLSDPESTALRIENKISPEFLAARMERLIERSVTMAAGGKDPGARVEIGDIKVVTPEEAAKAAAGKK